jgi:hypothetical protein
MSTRNMLRGVAGMLGVLALVGPVTGGTTAKGDPGQEGYAEARRELLERVGDELEQLAALAQAERLYLERDRCYAALLTIEPEHAEARRHLQYRRTKSGWEQRGYRAPKNRGGALAAFTARRAELEASLRAELARLVERYELEGDSREECLEQILLVSPDDPGARARRGEVQDPEGDWVLAETAAARALRAELQRLRAEPRDEAEIVDDARAGAEDAGMKFQAALSSLHARLRACTDRSEAESLLRNAELAMRLFERCLGEVPALPGDLTIFVLGCSRTRREFLDHHPRADESVAELEHGLSSAWAADRSTLVVCSEDAEVRRDHTARQTVQRMLSETYGIGPADGWVYEGFGLALAERVTGSADVARTTSVLAGRWQLGEEKTLWQAARAGIASGQGPRLGELLGKELADYTREDVLLAYAFACYLLEGHGARAAQVLDRIGHSEDPCGEVLEQELGRGLATIEARFARWVAEMQ